MSASGHTKKTTDWLGRPKEEHFDEHGHKTGETRFEKDWLGRDVQVHYDESGTKVGETRRGQDWLGRDRAEHYDANGQSIGHSKDDTDWLGQPIQRHFEDAGTQVGVTRRTTGWLGRPQKEHEVRFFKVGRRSDKRPHVRWRLGGCRGCRRIQRRLQQRGRSIGHDPRPSDGRWVLEMGSADLAHGCRTGHRHIGGPQGISPTDPQ